MKNVLALVVLAGWWAGCVAAGAAHAQAPGKPVVVEDFQHYRGGRLALHLEARTPQKSLAGAHSARTRARHRLV